MKHKFLLVAAVICIAGCGFTNVHNDATDNNSQTPSEKSVNRKTDYGPVITRTYNLKQEYKELKVSNAFEVTMSDDVQQPTITLDSALHEQLIFRIHDGELQIGLKSGRYQNIQSAKVKLPVNKKLSEIELNHASSLTIFQPLSANTVSIEINHASNFTGNITKAKKVEIEANAASQFVGEIQYVDVLDVELSGASNATISGSTDRLDIDLKGASQLNTNLDAHTVEGEISGASEASVLCCDLIRVSVSGSSQLIYGTIADGCDPIVDIHSTGASTVSRR